MTRRVQVIIAAVLTLAVAGTAIWYGVSRRAHREAQPVATQLLGRAVLPAEVTLTPTLADSSGVDEASTFRLTAVKPLSAAEVQKQLTVTPAVDVRVQKTDADGKQFTITPAKLLQTNKVYRFKLAPAAGVSRAYQWSFQTHAAFRVLGSLPRNQGTGVPANTGIEVTFSHDNYADIEPYFDISPKVEGRFERHKRTVAFVPKEPLAPGTVYTVTLRKGLPQTGSKNVTTQDFVFAFETQPENTGKGGQNQPYFYVPSDMQEFAATDAPYFMVSTSINQMKGMAGGSVVDVATYRYSDAAGFIAALAKLEQVPWWANYNREKQREDVGALAKVGAFQAEPKTFPGANGPYIMFPEALPPGYYLTEFSAFGITRQVRFQVTDLSSYLAVTSTKTLIWVNDLNTKSPVRGAAVTLSGGTQPLATGPDGVALLPTPPGADRRDQPSGLFYTVTTGAKEAVVAATTPSYYRWDYRSTSDRGVLYWKYLYLDRTLYKPDDKVNLWGVVRAREPGAAPVTQVTVELIRNDYRGYDERPVPLATATLPVQEGTFIGSLALPGVRPGYYELQVKMGEDYLLSRWFEVKTYTKPAYKLDVSASKRALFAGESVDFGVRASFFEGTPVANLQLTYNLGWSKDGATITTDSGGKATVTYVAPALGDDYGYGGPNTVFFNVHSYLPEAGDISGQASVQVFTRNLMMMPSVKVDGSQATLSAKVNRVTLDLINSGKSDWNSTGDPVPGLTIRGTVTENNWIREDDGEYYDFIQKTVQKRYRYRPDFREVGRFTAATDSVGVMNHILAIDPDKSYQVKLQVEDLSGRTLARDLSFYGRQYSGLYGNMYRYFRLQPETPKYQWALGEDIGLVMNENEGPILDRAQGFLFFTSRLGLQSVKVQDRGTFHYTLQPTDLPNTSAKAVYFDGRMYREASEFSLRIDPKDRELKVAVTTDKPSYRPGETVNVTVQATDKAGRPVKAQVNVNLVDEALYALSDQRVDLLASLLGEHVPSGILRTRRSHNVPEPGSAAEKGGDGGGARKDFQDAIFFANLSTDAAGKATASFRVPDNLTTWRLTYQAFAPGSIEGASATVPVPVKLPFFVEPVVGETYLSGDKPVVTVRSYGTSLQQGQTVEFAVKVTAPDGATALETQRSGSAFDPVDVALPALTVGTYTVQVAGTAPGGLSDTIEKRVTVVDSYVRQNKVDFQLLKTDTRVTGGEKGMTTLTFTDYTRGRYLRLLQSLQWQWGNRFEQKLARSVATDLLKQYFDQKDAGAEPDLDTFSFQAPDGGIAIVPYADSDLQLSALAADLAPTRFDQAALSTYFEKVLDDPAGNLDRMAQALYGLAALDRPVLQNVQALLTKRDLTLTHKVHLALASAELGDLEGARAVYYGLLQAQGEQLGSNARIKAGSDQDEIVSATALVAALSTKLGEPFAPAFVGYLLENPPKEVLVLIEQLLTAQAGLAGLSSEPVSFTYTLGGKEEKKDLKAGQVFRLPLTAAAVNSLRFTAVTGQVGLTVSYEAPLDMNGLKKQPGFSLSRTYTVDGRAKDSLRPGDLIKVTLEYAIPGTAPGGSYEVTDYLPSGLRLVQRPWQRGEKTGPNEYLGWPLEVNGQKVTFYASKDGKPIVYFARVASAGSYSAELPVLQHQKSGLIFANGTRGQVRIE